MNPSRQTSPRPIDRQSFHSPSDHVNIPRPCRCSRLYFGVRIHRLRKSARPFSNTMPWTMPSMARRALAWFSAKGRFHVGPRAVEPAGQVHGDLTLADDALLDRGLEPHRPERALELRSIRDRVSHVNSHLDKTDAAGEAAPVIETVYLRSRGVNDRSHRLDHRLRRLAGTQNARHGPGTSGISG